jgi:O-antigen/teichoic acid export membrane protein
MNDSRSKSLLKETIIYSIGNFGSKVLSFLLLPIYTFFLSKEDLGNYDILLTTVGLFVPMVSLQISDAVYRWIINSDKSEEKFIKKAISNGFFLTVFSFLFFLFLFGFYICNFAFKDGIYFILILFVSCFLPFLQQTLRGLGRTKFYSLIGIQTSLLVLLSNVVFVYFLNWGLAGVYLANIVAFAISIVTILIFGKIGSVISYKFISIHEMREMLRYTLPLVPNLMSWWIINSSSKFLILYYLGVEYNGIYAVSSRFPSILMIVNSVFLMAFQDHVLSDSKQDTQSLNLLFNRFIKIELSLVLFFSVISPFIIKITVSPEYYEAWKFMPLLYLGAGLSAISAYVGFAYMITKNTVGVTITTFVGALVNIIFSYFFIDYMGLYACALGLVLSYFIVIILRIKQVRQIVKFQINTLEISTLFFIGLFAIAMMYTNYIILHYIVLFGSLSFCLVYNKDYIFKILKFKVK